MKLWDLMTFHSIFMILIHKWKTNQLNVPFHMIVIPAIAYQMVLLCIALTIIMITYVVTKIVVNIVWISFPINIFLMLMEMIF